MQEQENTSNASSVFLAFLAGAALGAGFALLAAPKTGKELRDTLSDLTDDAVNKVKEYATEAQNKLNATLEAGRELMKEKKSTVASAIDEGRASMQ